MKQGFDLQCEELKNKLVEEINSSELPITVIEYILKDILAATQRCRLETLEQQRKQAQQTQDKIINMQEDSKDGNTE